MQRSKALQDHQTEHHQKAGKTVAHSGTLPARQLTGVLDRPQTLPVYQRPAHRPDC
jgi:hypothetical protein